MKVRLDTLVRLQMGMNDKIIYNGIETCHNCNLLYSTVSIHKLSRVIFLDPLFINFTLSLQGLLFGSIPTAIHA
jgi:hypothetical protein